MSKALLVLFTAALSLTATTSFAAELAVVSFDQADLVRLAAVESTGAESTNIIAGADIDQVYDDAKYVYALLAGLVAIGLLVALASAP